jgi:acyl carrier protein
MTKEEFLVEMQDVLQIEKSLTMETVLTDLPEWDSLSVMATMAFLSKNFGIKSTMSDYKVMKTIGDIAVKAGIQ